MGALLRRSTWVWPLAFAALLSVVGWHALSTLRETMRDQLESELKTTLAAARASLEIWSEEHRVAARVQASDPEVRAVVQAYYRGLSGWDTTNATPPRSNTYGASRVAVCSRNTGFVNASTQ